MSIIGWKTGERIVEILWQVNNWSQKTKWGKVFDASTGFVDPDGNSYSPRIAWVEGSRIAKLDPNPEAFLPLAPDFTIEFRCNATEDLVDWRAKMASYRDLGVRLSWLINLPDRQLEIYHIDRDPAVLEAPNVITGEDVLPWFELDLSKIWELRIEN
jgi:Uma2 family endonuclease